MTREKKQNNNSVEKRVYILRKVKKKKNNCKRFFSADLTIAFILVTVLSIPCSFGGWFVQIKRLEEGEFWVPMCVESLMG